MNIKKLIKETVDEMWMGWEEGKGSNENLCTVCGGNVWQHAHMNGKVLWCAGSEQKKRREDDERHQDWLDSQRKKMKKEIAPVKPNKLSYEDQIERLIAKAWKAGDAEAYVWYTLAYGKTSALAGFEQFKGSAAYPEWKRKNADKIQSIEKEMSRFSFTRNEAYSSALDMPGAKAKDVRVRETDTIYHTPASVLQKYKEGILVFSDEAGKPLKPKVVGKTNAGLQVKFVPSEVEEGYGGDPDNDDKYVKGHRWTVKWNEDMKLKETIKECVAEVLKEYEEKEELSLIRQIAAIANEAVNGKNAQFDAWKSHPLYDEMFKIKTIADRLSKMHKEDPHPSVNIPIKK